MLRLKSSDPDFGRAFTRSVKDRRESDENVARDVQTIIEDVRSRGDAASAEYTERFDNHSPGDDDWRIAPEACRDAFETSAPDLRAASESAAQRIRTYHEAQRPQDRDYVDDAGIRLGAKWRAVDGAGLYVPGGRAAYPSSSSMNAIPAKVAGVERLVIATPTPKGEINPSVSAAAPLAGVDEVRRVGRAHAIAASAYGTARIRPVDVIPAPVNAWVADATRPLYRVVSIVSSALPPSIPLLPPATYHP
ncbi:hypothetical protein OY671_008506, partial [Metschnikowia pulcherrima]